MVFVNGMPDFGPEYSVKLRLSLISIEIIRKTYFIIDTPYPIVLST
jgi:hypothetical protein